MRDDRQRLLDILEAAKLLQSFQAGHSRMDLGREPLLQSGLLHQLMVIGEAASRISAALQERYPAIPWRAMSGFRNYIAHEYFSLDLDIRLANRGCGHPRAGKPNRRNTAARGFPRRWRVRIQPGFGARWQDLEVW